MTRGGGTTPELRRTGGKVYSGSHTSPPHRRIGGRRVPLLDAGRSASFTPIERVERDRDREHPHDQQAVTAGGRQSPYRRARRLRVAAPASSDLALPGGPQTRPQSEASPRADRYDRLSSGDWRFAEGPVADSLVAPARTRPIGAALWVAAAPGASFGGNVPVEWANRPVKTGWQPSRSFGRKTRSHM
jgi:hypothetical protein